jgi:hypothetical protein
VRKQSSGDADAALTPEDGHGTTVGCQPERRGRLHTGQVYLRILGRPDEADTPATDRLYAERRQGRAKHVLPATLDEHGGDMTGETGWC